jgi:antitoxin HicB
MSSTGRKKKRPVVVPVLEVRFHRTATGTEPVRDWLLGVQAEGEKGAEACKRIGTDILKVQYRWPVGKPLVDSIGGGLFEETSKRVHDGAKALEGDHVTRKGSIGSTFDSFLDEAGIREEVQAAAMKEVIAEELAEAMAEQQVSLSELGRRMNTSRTAVRRLLDPRETGLTLESLGRAAEVLNCRLRIEITRPAVRARRAQKR